MATKVSGGQLLGQFLADHPGELASEHDPQRLMSHVGIWLPLAAYATWPIMMPWAVRDLGCRRRYLEDGRDMWSWPDEQGYLVDDNSFMKGTTRSQGIRSATNPLLDGAKMKGGFVAAHIWRVVRHELLASKIPRLYSFIPNVVWLPGQIAKLTDIEGGPFQQTLQAMSLAIYRDALVNPALKDVVEASWAMLPAPRRKIQPVDLAELNWFSPGPQFYRTRSRHLATVVKALEEMEAGKGPRQKVISSKYTAGLPLVEASAREALLLELQRFPAE